jgi:hypothetical protein
MPKVRKIARYTVETLLVLVPLAVVVYFLAYPDRFQCVLELADKTVIARSPQAAPEALFDQTRQRFLGQAPLISRNSFGHPTK